MHKIPTREQAQKGGRARARQWAAYRREHPTDGERRVRLAAALIAFNCHGSVMSEWEIVHPDGRPQFVDIMLYIPLIEVYLAIEVDGSHGWHGYNGSDMYGKMSAYDEMKARWCDAHGVGLLRLNASERGLTNDEIKSAISDAIVQTFLRRNQNAGR